MRRENLKKLFLGIVIIMLMEIAFFIFIGNKIGILNTLMLVLFMSFIGMIITKKLGFKSIKNIQKSVEYGEPPGNAMIDALLIFVGGVLLLLPGFLTDIIGLTMFISATRKFYKVPIYNWLRKKLKHGNIVIIQK